MNTTPVFVLPAFMALLLPVLSGCGDSTNLEGRSDVYPVQGQVMYNGSPVAGATVLFYSQSDKLTAGGLTNDQGEFQLRTYVANDGAVAGRHKITVKKSEGVTVPNPEDPNLPPLSSEEVWKTPKKYADLATTPLEETVSATAPNTFTLTLED